MPGSTKLGAPVNLPHAVADVIVQHAREGKPEEVCGIVRGRGLDAFEAVCGRNVAEERIENYTVDPQTLLMQFDFEDEGDEMMAIYHSHPVSVAYPSATDAWNAAYPDSIYLICSLEDDAAPVIRGYRMLPHFIELDLTALTAALDFYETRPGLFAYYVDPADAVPAALSDLPSDIQPPYYVVYVQPEDAPDEREGRVVTLVEHPVEISG
jgi:proteasome lid subunit RPN8/RPN11